MTLKLNKRKKEDDRGKATKVTTCLECGSPSVEWKLTLEEGIRHAYVCNECGHTGDVVLEREVPSV